jgi:hypothetical protein
MYKRISESFKYALLNPAVHSILLIGNFGNFLLMLGSMFGYLPRTQMLVVAAPITFVASTFILIFFLINLFRRT